MSQLSYRIRLGSCCIWMVTGIIQGGYLGYFSALASLGFYVAMRLDAIGYGE